MNELSITSCDLPKRARDIYTDSSFEFAKYRLARACVPFLAPPALRGESS